MKQKNGTPETEAFVRTVSERCVEPQRWPGKRRGFTIRPFMSGGTAKSWRRNPDGLSPFAFQWSRLPLRPGAVCGGGG
jgi:hypothetical protein